MNKKNNSIVIITALVVIALITVGYYMVPKGVSTINVTDENGGNNDKGIKVYIGCENQIVCDIQPKQFDPRCTKLKVADTSVAEVSGGIIKGKTIGSTLLIVEAVNCKEKIQIEVLPSVKDIKNLEDEISLTTGDEEQLEPELELAGESVNKKDIKISFKSKDESIATVDDNGEIKALKEGETEIVISAGSCSTKVKVTVSEPVVYKSPATNTHRSSGGNNSSGDGGGWE